MNPHHSFEGSEKKLEIAFHGKNLRQLSREFWTRVVEATGAHILSEMSGEKIDAYLLSESSLLVFDDRFLMLTCGTTRLIDAVKVVLQTLGKDTVASVFFERKNEVFPEAQTSSFESDVTNLRKWFPHGKTQNIACESIGGQLRLFYWNHSDYVDQPAIKTLLMHDLDPRVLETLIAPDSEQKMFWSASLILKTVFPNFEVDEHWFEPWGYSLNGISGREYFTLHISPEPWASYASLETNRSFVSEVEFQKGIQTVLQLLKPRTSFVAQSRRPAPGTQSKFDDLERNLTHGA